MRKFILICVLMAVQVYSYSQNLVANGDFESYSSLPDNLAQVYKCIGWTKVNNLAPGAGATPDYFHTMGTGNVKLPNSLLGNIMPYSGNAILGFHTSATFGFEYREYVSTQLSSAMIPGVTYKISYWLSSGFSHWLYGYSSNHIGTLLSTAVPYQAIAEPIAAVPQYEVPGNVWETSWRNISFIITADSAYQYITFGNFAPDNLTTTILQVNAIGGLASYYFIDKVEVIPALRITGSTICSGGTAILSATGGYGNASYTWADSLNPSVIISNTNLLNVSPITTTTYYVYSNTDTAKYTVVVHPLPQVALGNDTSFCDWESLTISIPHIYDSYLWQDGSTQASYTVTHPGDYWLQISKDGCYNSDTITVSAKLQGCDCELKVMNAFTPNGDGFNDVWKISSPDGNCIRNTIATVYNRYGSKVYEAKHYDNSWDGRYNGKPLPDGTYYYILDVDLVNGQKVFLRGDVTILR